MKKSVSPKTALFINFDAKPGGAERRFVRFFLYSKNSRLHLILNKDGRRRLDEIGVHTDDARVIDFDYPKSSFALLNKLFVFLNFWKIVLVNRISHVHYPIDPSVYTFFHAILSRLTGVTYSISMVDSSRTKRSDLGRFQFYLWKFSLQYAKSLDVLSDGIVKNIHNIFGFVPKHEVSPCSFTDYSRSFSEENKVYDLVLMSRLVDGKGLDIFFEALHLISEAGAASKIGRIGIFGDGPLKGYVESEAALLPQFSIEMGYAKNSFEIFSRSKVFLSLQQSENYPSQSILEALSCGALVVATDVGETYRVVPSSVGIRVKPTPKDLAEGCIRALARWESGEYDSALSIAFVKQNFSIEKFSEYFERFLLQD